MGNKIFLKQYKIKNILISLQISNEKDIFQEQKIYFKRFF